MMKKNLFFFLLSLLLTGCGDRPVKTKDLGQGYEFADAGHYQSVRRNMVRLNRGKIDLLYYDKKVIIGYLSTEDDPFEGVRGENDIDGYFLIDKKTEKFIAVGLNAVKEDASSHPPSCDRAPLKR